MGTTTNTVPSCLVNGIDEFGTIAIVVSTGIGYVPDCFPDVRINPPLDFVRNLHSPSSKHDYSNVLQLARAWLGRSQDQGHGMRRVC